MPGRVLLGVVCALTATATLAAASPPPPDDWVHEEVVVEQQVAVDPAPVVVVQEPVQPPYVDPYYYPDPYPQPVFVDEGPRESIVATASAMQAWLSQPSGLETMGRGGTLGFTFLQRRGDFPTGAEATGIFLFGDQASVYDLSLRMIASPKIGKRLLVPFVAVGLAIGASRVVDARSTAMQVAPKITAATYGFAIGPSAALGVHGFVGKKWYWRAGAGYVGAGVGAITADLGVGMVVD